MNRTEPNGPRVLHQVHRNSVVFFHGAICAVIVLAGFVLSGQAGPGAVTALSWVLTVTVTWSMWSWWQMTGTVFDPYGMFTMSLFLFNAGQALLEIVGLNERGMLRGRFDDQSLVATLYMVLLGLAFTHFGALLAVRRLRPSRRAAPTTADSHGLRVVGWGLLAISIIPASLIVVDTGKTIMAGGYMASFQRESLTGVSAGPQVIGMFIVPACLFLLVGANGRRRERTTAAIVIGLYTLAQLFLGDRGGAIMAACTFGWLWHRCEGQIKTRWLVGAGLMIMMVIVPIIRETRGLAGPDRIKLDTFKNAYRSIENPIVSSISEMGGSMFAVAYTYEAVPTRRQFDHGIGYAYAALTVLPNLFWSIHPTIAHGTASDWLIETANPYAAARGGGLGFSGVAEAYLNFGWVGVPIIMGLVGFGMGRLTIWASGCANPRHLAMAAAFTVFVLKFPRDETASLLRFFVWYSWAPYAVATLIAAFATRQAFLRSQPLIRFSQEASEARSL